MYWSYGYGSKLGTPKLWMVNTKLDIHICGPLGLPFWPTTIYSILILGSPIFCVPRVGCAGPNSISCRSQGVRSCGPANPSCARSGVRMPSAFNTSSSRSKQKKKTSKTYHETFKKQPCKTTCLWRDMLQYFATDLLISGWIYNFIMHRPSNFQLGSNCLAQLLTTTLVEPDRSLISFEAVALLDSCQLAAAC